MRCARNVRQLAQGERDVALPVFRLTIPYDKILISDGLGVGGAVFTLPTSVPTSPCFRVAGYKDSGRWVTDPLPRYEFPKPFAKYVIHAGDRYNNEMSKSQPDKELLIHELAHVWQGEHWTSKIPYWLDSAWNQAVFGMGHKISSLSNVVSDALRGAGATGLKRVNFPDAYHYDTTRLLDWDDYNAEQQASIVEHWYHNGMNFNPDEDFRSYYVLRHIWGLKSEPDWLEERRRVNAKTVEPLPGATLDLSKVSPDGSLLPILQMRFHASDVAGAAARVKQLEAIFRGGAWEQLCPLVPRLEKRRNGDKVSELFHDRLSTASRNKLMTILRTRCNPK